MALETHALSAALVARLADFTILASKCTLGLGIVSRFSEGMSGISMSPVSRPVGHGAHHRH